MTKKYTLDELLIIAVARLITQKGIFDFDPLTKEMVLAEIHPRISVEDIKREVPWELKV